MWFNNLPFSLYGSLWPSFWSSPFRFDWCQNEFQESVNIDANEPMFNLNLNYFIKNINFYSNKLIHFLLIHLVLPIWRWWWSFCILTLISIFGQFTISHLIFIAISWWSRITTRRYISCLLSLCRCRILRIVLNNFGVQVEEAYVQVQCSFKNCWCSLAWHCWEFKVLLLDYRGVHFRYMFRFRHDFYEISCIWERVIYGDFMLKWQN